MKPMEKTQELMEALSVNTVVTSLTMKQCGLTDACMPLISDYIASTSTLTKLNLASNLFKEVRVCGMPADG